MCCYDISQNLKTNFTIDWLNFTQIDVNSMGVSDNVTENRLSYAALICIDFSLLLCISKKTSNTAYGQTVWYNFYVENRHLLVTVHCFNCKWFIRYWYMFVCVCAPYPNKWANLRSFLMEIWTGFADFNLLLGHKMIHFVSPSYHLMIFFSS